MASGEVPEAVPASWDKLVPCPAIRTRAGKVVSAPSFPSPLWGGAGVGVSALNWTSVALTPPPPTPPHKGEEGSFGVVIRTVTSASLMLGNSLVPVIGSLR